MILAGSVLGFLLFGQGKHFNALQNVTSSTLPPDYVSGSTYGLDDLSCQDGAAAASRADQEASEEVSPLVRHQSVESRRDNGELEHIGSSAESPPCVDHGDGVRKVDIRIDSQGDVIPEFEFMKRLDSSKETVL